jgi:hypothetical protein
MKTSKAKKTRRVAIRFVVEVPADAEATDIADQMIECWDKGIEAAPGYKAMFVDSLTPDALEIRDA